MSKQFTVITKDGSKWLRETDTRSADTIYLGSCQVGVNLSEENVVVVTQCRVKNAPSDNWQELGFGKVPAPNFLFETRLAYIDAESDEEEGIMGLIGAVAEYRRNHPEELPATEPDYPGIDYQPLFDHMSKVYGLTLTTGEMDDIIGLSTYILGKK